MMYYLITGITLGFSAGLSPGPLMALVLSETIDNGRKAGLLVAIAPLLTDIPIILVSLLLVNFLADSEPALGILSLGGGLYLTWLSKENFKVKEIVYEQKGGHRSLVKGMIANFLNPAPYLFWITVGATTIIKGFEINTFTVVLFVSGFYLFLIGSKVIIALIIGTYRSKISPVAFRIINYILGILLLILAVKFFYDGLMYL